MENNTRSDTAKRESTKAENAADKHQLIVFKLGAEEYGIHIDQIKEVVLTPRVTKMPQTPSYVKGVANIRGNVLSIIDLEEKFGIEQREPSTDESNANYTLVAESKDFSIGILVKEVPNTLTVMTSDIDETINVVQNSEEHGNYILGIVKVDERLIILMDLLQIMQTSNLNSISKETLVSE